MVPAPKGGWISEGIFQFDPILEKMGEITVPLLETSREKLRDSDFAYSYDDGIKMKIHSEIKPPLQSSITKQWQNAAQ